MGCANVCRQRRAESAGPTREAKTEGETGVGTAGGPMAVRVLGLFFFAKMQKVL